MNIKQVFLGFKQGIKKFGFVISKVINYLLLSFVYIIGVGFTSIIAKLSGKQFLDVNNSKKNSYWTDLKLKKKTLEQHYRQF